MLIIPTEHVIIASSQYEVENSDFKCDKNISRQCISSTPLTAFVTENGDLYIGHYNESVDSKGALYKVRNFCSKYYLRLAMF